VEILVRFETHTDARFPFMYHCHLQLHEDQGMMGQFVVVERRPSQARRPASQAPTVF